ncbi:MAG: hypothetical protein QXI91_00055 [Candidatus Bathyarchaeia archaeon]
MRRKAKQIKEFYGEAVLLSSPASLCKGRFGFYGGYLLLTRSRILFNPAKFGGFGKKVEIPIDSIVKVSSKKSFGGEENILNIVTKEKEYNFSLLDLNNWLTKINELLKKLENG